MTEKLLEYGPQPLDEILRAREIKNHDLVAASGDGLTHKQVQKGRKGRFLTPRIRQKIADALSTAAGEPIRPKQLFNYR
jgi:hypothetical protein